MRFTVPQSPPRKKFDPHQWHMWFAWYPVRIKQDTWVWLETITRRRIHTKGYRSAPAGCEMPVVKYWEYAE